MALMSNWPGNYVFGRMIQSTMYMYINENHFILCGWLSLISPSSEHPESADNASMQSDIGGQFMGHQGWKTFIIVIGVEIKHPSPSHHQVLTPTGLNVGISIVLIQIGHLS